MRYSRALIPTLKEAPADAVTASHVLLTRGGYIRRVGAGIYSFLPLGLRVLRRIERIVREEMDRSGALEVLLPALLPAEYFRESGRWDVFGDTLLRLKDRKGGDYHLGPTHEEIITDLARHEIKSYRDLPKNLYQIQSKYRDEPRPRAGLLRCREFSMKDAYSFDVDEAGALASYETMRKAYTRIFDRLGLDYRMVAADSGAMGGSLSSEFQVLAQSGEDLLVACEKCDYAANVEVATAGIPATAENPKTTELHAVKKVATPKKRTIAEVSEFLSLPPKRFLKSLVYMAGEQPVLAVVRGDHELNEVKLARALGVDEVRLAEPEIVVRTTGAGVGYAGPIGFKGRVVVDRAAADVPGGATGANETDHHFTDVVFGRDYDGEVKDIRSVAEGDPCPRCGSKLLVYRGIEAGHIFVLGTRYSAQMGANFLDQAGENKPMVMGCYGIGVSRLVATAVEQHHDENGIAWPAAISPYDVHVVMIGSEPEVERAAAELEQALEAQGLSVLVDDRDERPGVKFKDADLIGVPLRVTIGAKSLKSGAVELKPRSEKNPKNAELVPLESAVKVLSERARRSA
ncbi:MAG TPA: proline--tRNA ligase [Polyangiaceae bacterium]|nr:proline--tRNA ligase [Polyangiaceae bacterium]